MQKKPRAALFLDLENFTSTLKSRQQLERQNYKLDFKRLVNYIQEHYGTLAPEDFIAVANFSHYDRQKGGLNQVATLINVDSFEIRQERKMQQPSPGKKYVMKDYADFRLAFEVGRHAAINPADIYILGSGDKAFTAVSQALIQQGLQVLFLIANPLDTALIIKEKYTYLDYVELVPPEQPEQIYETFSSEETVQEKSLVDKLCEQISLLRREFSNPVPVNLIKAMYGSEQAHQLIKIAQSQDKVDVWTDPNGIACISRSEERVFNKVVPSLVRTEFAERANLLYTIVKIAEKELKEPTRAEWRRSLKDHSNLSVREAKALLNELFDRKILVEGQLSHPQLSLETVITFLREIDSQFSKE